MHTEFEKYLNTTELAAAGFATDNSCQDHSDFQMVHTRGTLVLVNSSYRFVNNSLYIVNDHDWAVGICQLNLLFWNVVSPIYMLIGTFGNTLSIFVWSRRNLRQPTQHASVLLTWLAVFDLLVLYFGFCKHYLKKATYLRLDLQSKSDFVCKFSEFLLHLSIGCAVWTLAALSAERAMRIVRLTPRMRAVLHLDRNRESDRVKKAIETATVAEIEVETQLLRERKTAISEPAASKRAKDSFCSPYTRRPLSLNLLVFVILLSCSILNSHVFWTQRIELVGKVNACRVSSTYYSYFLHRIRPRIDFAFDVALPGLIIVVSTVLLLFAIICCVDEPSTKSQANANAKTKTKTRAEALVRKTSAVSKMSAKISGTLVAISIGFLLCNSPAKIYLLVYPVNLPSHALVDHPHDYFLLRFIWTVALFLQSLSNIINFFIYSLSNKLFRTELRRIFRRLNLCAAFRS